MPLKGVFSFGTRLATYPYRNAMLADEKAIGQSHPSLITIKKGEMKMKKMTMFAAVFGLAMVVGSVGISEAGCFIGCGGDDESVTNNRRNDSDNIGGDQIDNMGQFAVDSVVAKDVTIESGDTHAHISGDVIGSQVQANSTALMQGVDKSHDNISTTTTTFNVDQ